jgi:hypothetical protein
MCDNIDDIDDCDDTAILANIHNHHGTNQTLSCYRMYSLHSQVQSTEMASDLNTASLNRRQSIYLDTSARCAKDTYRS